MHPTHPRFARQLSRAREADAHRHAEGHRLRATIRTARQAPVLRTSTGDDAHRPSDGGLAVPVRTHSLVRAA